MPRFNNLKTTFSAGELSPKLDGRTDIPQYAQGAKQIENMLVMPQGGVTRRPGTQYVADAKKNASGKGAWCRLIPFVFSKTEGYVVSLSDVSFDQGIFVVNSSGTKCTLTDSSTGGYSFTRQEIYEVQYVQSADVLYLVHANHKPLKLKRTSSSTFTLEDYDKLPTGEAAQHQALRIPFRDPNLTQITLASNNTHVGDTVTLTAGNLPGGVTSVFTTDHVGAYFKLTHPTGQSGIIKITGYNSGTSLTGTVIVAIASTATTTDWQESSWSPYRGWPRAVTLFEGRLIFGGNTAQPDTIWASKSKNYDHFMAERLEQDASTDTSGVGFVGSEPVETDPFSFTIASQEVNQIQWLSSGRALTIGTLGGEFTATGGDRILSSESVQFTSHTAFGSTYRQAIKADQSLLFVTRDGKRVREFGYEFEKDGYKAPDLSVLADHILRSSQSSPTLGTEITALAWQSSRSILWAVLQNPSNELSLIGLTLNKEFQITAWHRHSLGGQALTGSSAYITGLCVIPNATGTYDDLWLCVIRAKPVSGTVYYSLEKMGSDFEAATIDVTDDNSEDRPWFSDCALRSTPGAPTVTHSGFTHLANETVSVLADGKVHPNVTVSAGGVITLSFPAEEVIAGHPYTSLVQTMRIEAGSALGSAQGEVKRIDKVVPHFYLSAQAKVGQSEAGPFETLNFRDVGVAFDAAIPLYSGNEKEVLLSADYGKDGFVVIKGDQPLPLTITSIVMRGVVYE